MEYIDKALKMEAKGNLTDGLLSIHMTIDEMFWDDKFKEHDDMLQNLDITPYTPDILMGIIVASFPAYKKLQYYNEFVIRVKKMFIEKRWMKKEDTGTLDDWFGGLINLQ